MDKQAASCCFLFLPSIMNNNLPPLKSKALDFLARRDYAYHELLQRLLQYGYELEEIRTVLDDLKQKRFIDDARYAENIINSKSRKYGSLKIRHILQQKIANNDIIRESIANNPQDELATACTLLRKKYREAPSDNNTRAKYMRFLISRGFNSSIALKAITSAFNSEDESMYE